MGRAATPMMEQYFRIKENYRDCILLYRIGDFYEMFGEDAIIGSKVLEITLTSRDKGKKDKDRRGALQIAQGAGARGRGPPG